MGATVSDTRSAEDFRAIEKAFACAYANVASGKAVRKAGMLTCKRGGAPPAATAEQGARKSPRVAGCDAGPGMA